MMNELIFIVDFVSLFPFVVNKFEVECLIKLFNNLDVEPSDRHAVVGLDRNSFRNILHVTFGMTDDMIMDRGEVKSMLINYSILKYF